MARGIKTSAAASWKLRESSAGSGVSPFCEALWKRFITADFSPEKEQTKGASGNSGRGRR